MPISQVYAAPCGDIYCATCLTKKFENALADESLFPPRCCRHEIALSSIKALLGEALTARVMLKLIEYTSVDKTYCFRSECSSFIYPVSCEHNAAKCNTCRHFTCTQCKREYHNGTCDEVNHQALVDMAERLHWQRCCSCKTFVELASGCNHIT